MRALLVVALLAGVAAPALADCGKASWYGTESGTKTATGEHFDGTSLTAASRTLPEGTIIKVTVVDPRKKLLKIRGNHVNVRINDYGPAEWTGHALDLAKAAARHLGMIDAGVVLVCWEIVH